MALARAIISKLNKTNESLEDQLNLAKKIYSLNKINLSNRKELIINWIFEEIENYINFSISHVSKKYALLWQTLYELLKLETESSTCQVLLIQNHSIEIITECLKNYSRSNNDFLILPYVKFCVSLPSFYGLLIYEDHLLFPLMFACLEVITKIKTFKPVNAVALEEAKSLAIILLEYSNKLSKDVSKLTFVAIHLENAAAFVHNTFDDTGLKYLNEKLCQIIVKSIEVAEFETFLTPPEGADAPKSNTNIKKFFTSLQKLISKQALSTQPFMVSTFLKTLMTTFFSLHKSGYTSLKFLSVMCAASGLDVPLRIHSDSCCSYNLIQDGYISVPAVSSLLEASSLFPQYFNSELTSEEFLRPLNWLKGVEAGLLDIKNTPYQSSWFRCFQSFLKISTSSIVLNIVPVIKNTILDVYIQDEDAQKEYCNFFVVLLHLHSQLRQIPKFFVKLLLALTESAKENCSSLFIAEGKIYPQILEAVAKVFYEIPFAQTAELWKIFVEIYPTFENMSQMFQHCKGILFYTAQLFSTFLLHSKFFDDSVPSSVYSKFGELIELTLLELEKSIYILKETDSETQSIQNSFLVLTHAIGEVKLAYDCFDDNTADTSEVKFPDHPFDLSLLLPFFQREHADVLQTLLNGKNQMQSFLVFQLLLQKMKILLYKEKLFKNEKNHLDLTLSTVLKHIQENNSAILPWDSDIFSLNQSNYSTCIWRKTMKMLPIFLEILSFKDLLLLCSLMQDVIHQHLNSSSSEMDAKCVIKLSLRNEVIQESKQFQTAFITSMWKPEHVISNKRTFDEMNEDQNIVEKILNYLCSIRSKWAKYANSTPKNGEMNHLWSNLGEISAILNEILTSGILKQNLNLDRVKNIIEIIKCLPLGYLLPSNQHRIIIGLSLLLLLVSRSIDIEAISLSKEISLLIVSIVNGTRSVWLFDFVDSGSYLKAVFNCLSKVAREDDLHQCKWVSTFVKSMLSLSLSNGKYICKMNEYVSELARSMKSSKFSAFVMQFLMHKLSQILKRVYLQDNHREACLKLFSIVFSNIIKCTKKDIASNESDYNIFFIKCYVEIVDIILLSSSNIDEEKQKKALKLLPQLFNLNMKKFCDFNDEAHVETFLYFLSKISFCMKDLKNFMDDDFVELSWTAIFSYLQRKSKKIGNSFSNSNLSLMKDFIPKEFPLNDKSQNHICPSTASYFDRNHASYDVKNCEEYRSIYEVPDEVYLNAAEIDVFKSLFATSSEKEISAIVLKLAAEMEYSDIATADIFSLQMKLVIIKYFIKYAVENSVLHIIALPLQNVLSNLQVLTSQTCNSFVCKFMVSVPILKFVSFTLGTGKILHMHAVLQTLHFCPSLKLDIENKNYSTFIVPFDAVWNLVYCLLNQHSTHIISSKVAFTSYVSYLLKTLVSCASQDALALCEKTVYEQMILCAQNMERLLSLISKHKVEFEKLVPYLIADYVDSIQHVTLDQNIKDHLVMGINRLLNICSEDSIKMLAVNVNRSCREIYANLVKSFKQYKTFKTS